MKKKVAVYIEENILQEVKKHRLNRSKISEDALIIALEIEKRTKEKREALLI